jgi:hypothetical protein
MIRILLLGLSFVEAMALCAQEPVFAGSASPQWHKALRPITHDATSVHWGEAVDGVQFGLLLEADAFSVKCDLLVRYQGKRETGSVNTKIRTEVYYESLGECYRVEPSTMQYLPDEVILRGPAGGGWWRNVDMGRVLRPGEELLMERFIIPRLQRTWDEDCYRLNEWPDALEMVVNNVLVNDRTEPTAMSTGRVPIRYCERENFAKDQQIAEARFFDLLLKLQSPDITALCIRLVQDTVQDELVRGEAMLYLAQLNTDTARDVLYAQCLLPDPQLSELLNHFFDTGDPRAGELFRRYARHHDLGIQRDVAYGIGTYADEHYFDLLKPMRTANDRWVRKSAVYALQFFDTDASRGLLCESLLDGDLEVRTQAVRGLSKVGNERSLHYLANYIDQENPNNVGYVSSAWEVVEKISGRSFDRDLAMLKGYLKEKKR